MNRNKDESYLAFARRLVWALNDNIIDYDEFGDSLLGDANTYNADNIRKASYVLRKFFNLLDEDYDEFSIDEFEQLKKELKIERKKLQRVNQEYQANLRKEADTELYRELWLSIIENESPIEIKPYSYKRTPTSQTGLLCVADAHYGKEVSLYGIDGEVVNHYSPEIFQARMGKLLHDLVADIQKVPVDRIVVADLGDQIEGILRADKTLRSLRTGVIESANDYANYMASWLCQLYNETGLPVEYYVVGGNHDILRLLDGKKKFDDENMAMDVRNKIADKIEINKLRTQLEHNVVPEIIVHNYSDVAYINLYGMNILAYHGDTKDMKTDISFFENYYGIDVDILISGHFHRNSQESIGYGYMGDKEIIRVPSIIGTDDYAKRIRKSARAGALYMIFNEDGKQWTKTYYLN